MKILLVLGTLRCGKTLIARALSAHPAVKIAKEPYFYYFKLCRNIFHREFYPALYQPDAPMETDFLKSREEKESFKNNLKNLVFTERDIKELIELTAKQQDAEPGERVPQVMEHIHKLNPGTAAEVFEQLMIILRSACGGSRTQVIGFSDGWCEEFIEPMLNYFNLDINCIQMLRDPRAIYASRNKGADLMAKYGGTYPILFIARNWRKSVAYYYANKGNEKFLGIRYEDLVANALEYFRKICDFIDVDFVPDLLDADKYRTGDNKRWVQNTSHRPEKGITSSSVGMWRALMTDTEVKCLEYLCSKEMKLLGYDRINSTDSLESIINYDDGIECQIAWLKQYGYNLDGEHLEEEILRHHASENPEILSQEAGNSYFITDAFFQELLKARLS